MKIMNAKILLTLINTFSIPLFATYQVTFVNSTGFPSIVMSYELKAKAIPDKYSTQDVISSGPIVINSNDPFVVNITNENKYMFQIDVRSEPSNDSRHFQTLTHMISGDKGGQIQENTTIGHTGTVNIEYKDGIFVGTVSE